MTTSPTEELAASLMQYAPDVDIWGVNVYGSLLSRLPAKMKALGWTRAYAVTEYGPYVRCPCCCCVALRLQHALTRERNTELVAGEAD